jgi:hypothetical protein
MPLQDELAAFAAHPPADTVSEGCHATGVAGPREKRPRAGALRCGGLVGPGPRVRTHSRGHKHFYGAYKKHLIECTRDTRDEEWYIIVTHPDGGRLYDGWFNDSQTKTLREVIVEALRGAGLWPNA